MSAVPSPQAMVWLRMRWLLPQELNWKRRLIGLLSPLIFVILMMHISGSAWRSAAYSMGGILLSLAVCWPFLQLWAQNKPSWARLVPGHRRALQHASWLATVITLVLMTLLCGLLWDLSPAALLLLAPGLVLLLWILRRPRVVWPLVLLPPATIALLALLVKALPALKIPLAALMALLGSWPGLLLGCGLCLWALWRWVGNGDAAHRRDHAARLQSRRSAQRGWMPGKGWADRLLSLLAGWFTWPREWNFQRVLRADPVARVDHLLSRSAHWCVQLWVALQIGLVMGPLLWWAQSVSKPGSQALGDSLIALWIGVLSLAFSADVSRFQALWRRRREQALLALLPGLSPAPGVLTRALALRWLTRGLLAWSLVLLLMVLALPFCKAETQTAMGVALAGCLMLVPLCSLIDPARLTHNQRQDWLAQGGVLLACFAALPLARLGWPFAAAPLGAILLVLPWALWRWRRLAQAPAPFPVGRLADYSGNSVK